MQLIQPAPEATTAFQLSAALQSRLEPIGSEVSCAAGEVLFRQGTECVGTYVLRSGVARVFMRDDRGAMITCRDVGPGCILGLPATLCVQPYMFTAETKDSCTFAFIPADTFQEFLRTNPDLCMEVVQLMSRELAAVNRARTEPSKCSHVECALRPSCSRLTN